MRDDRGVDWSTVGVPAQPRAATVQQHTASSPEDGGSGDGGWLARHRTVEKVSAPHRLDIFKHGHRAMVVLEGLASLAPHHRLDERASSPGHF